MGDRANVYLESPARHEQDADGKYAPVEYGGVYYYTHWSGFDWPEHLRTALVKGKSRWGDPSYLNRILASEMYAPIHDMEGGGGIGPAIDDNEYLITVVEHDTLTVAWAKQGEEKDRAKRFGRMSFADFTAQDRAKYPGE